LVVSLSNHRVTKVVGFSGDELTIFSTIIRSGTPPYDAIIVVRGPTEEVSIRTRGDARSTNGRWIDLAGVPSYVAILSNRPVDEIAPDSMQMFQLNAASLPLSKLRTDEDLSPSQLSGLHEALVQHKLAVGMYRKDRDSVTFLTPDMLRAGVPVLKHAPEGTYEVRVLLFRDGNLVTETETAFEVVRVGMARFIHDRAVDSPFIFAFGLFALIFGGALAVLKLMIDESLSLLRW
jgi:uncharacterized protein (TIGR02186 family)